MDTKQSKKDETTILGRTAKLEIQIVYKHLSQTGALDTYLAEYMYGIVSK